MRREELVDCLLASLVELEQAGDLVITHPNPAALADRLCDSVIGTWSTEFLDEPPFEVVIENGLSSAALHLQKHFDVQRDDARHLVESFIEHIGSNRTKSAVAEFISHQGGSGSCRRCLLLHSASSW